MHPQAAKIVEGHADFPELRSMLTELANALDTRPTLGGCARATTTTTTTTNSRVLPSRDLARVMALLPTPEMARRNAHDNSAGDGTSNNATSSAAGGGAARKEQSGKTRVAARIRALHALVAEIEASRARLAAAEEAHTAADALVVNRMAEVATQEVARAAAEQAAMCLINRVKGAGSARRRYIYVMGGMSDRSRLAECERFNGVTWEPVVKLNRVRSAAAAASHRGMIYCLGGRENDDVHASVDAYDGHRWIAVAPMRYTRMACAAVSFQGSLCVPPHPQCAL